MAEENRVVSVRVPASIKKNIETAVTDGGYLNSSDFFRDAIREKLRLDFRK